MTISRTVKSLFLLLLFLSSLAATAKKRIPDPIKGKRVYDYAGILDGSEERRLEQKILGYEDTTSNQFVIFIDKSLEGEDDFGYAQRLAESWGIGQKGKNNGVLIAAFMKDRKIRILTGRGLEAAITDAESFQIYDQILKPAFQRKAYYYGFDEALTALMQAAAGEFQAEPGRGKGKVHLPLIGGILFLVIVIALFAGGRGRGGGGGFGRGFAGGYMAGRMVGGGWGNFSSGGGGFSGGGGGFSGGGFGGGSFGGGGSGGGW